MNRWTAILVVGLCADLGGWASAATLTVDDDGPAAYSSIQAAIDDANPGDVVFVMPGVYREAVVMKDQVDLRGYSAHLTTIDGEGTADHVVTFEGQVGAEITGFRIIGSSMASYAGSWHLGGIYCISGPLVIRNNIIEDNKAGIAVEPGGRPTIINNTIVNNRNGVIFRAGSSPYQSVRAVAVVYKDTRAEADAIAQLIEEAGLASVDTIPMDVLHKANLTSYGLIIVLSETGSGYSWGTPQAVAAVLESDRPVLGMGTGGASLFQQMGLSINWGHSWLSMGQNRLYVMDPEHPVFNTPNDIGIPRDRILEIYKESNAVGEYAPVLDPEVVLLGREPQDKNHFDLVQEGPHLLWGFIGKTGDMSKVGRDLFINVVSALTLRCYPQLPPPELVATGAEVIDGERLRYLLRVDNWYVYPPELFESLQTGPCPSRMDVDIYTEQGEWLYGFCGLGSPEGLTDLWFGYDAGVRPPRVYIRMTDRRCGTVWESNLVTPTVRPRITYTIMNNIIVNNSTGLFFYRYTAQGRILYNDVWGNSYRNYHDNATGSTFVPQPGTGEISADPQFDPGYPDTYILTETSPCKDTGNPAAAYNDPDGTRNDMGVWGGPQAGGPGSHPGGGFMFTDVGNLPANYIEQNPADPSHGLAVIDATHAAMFGVPAYKDSPFGGTLRIYGLFGEEDIHVRGVRYYQILIAPWPDENTPPTEPDDYTPITTALYKVHSIPQGDGTVLHEVVHIGPKEVGGVGNVYELTYTGWWSAINLRVMLNTRSLDNGKYTLTYRAYRPINLFGTTILIPVALPSNEMDHLDILVNNTPVEAVIHSVKYDPSSPNYDPGSDGEIPECGIITLQDPSENLRFTITAQHPDGYLRRWVLDAIWGKNHYAGVIASDSYPGTVPPDAWPGVVNAEFNSADATGFDPWQACSYQFRLRAYTRATNGQGYLYSTTYGYSQEFNDHYYIGFAACGWCGGADINRSGRVDLQDFARLAEEWMNTCAPGCTP